MVAGTNTKQHRTTSNTVIKSIYLLFCILPIQEMSPILDPIPTGKPHDWSFNRISELKGVTPEYPPSFKEPLVHQTVERDQADRGTCVGQASAGYADALYLILVGDLPSQEDKAQFKKDVVDEIGTTHDVLYPQSASAEQFYQMSRFIGNVDYPSGSEIRFAARSWIKNGYNLETQWHTDKKGLTVWTYPPGVRPRANGGFTQEQAEEFAKQHLAEGYAQVGTPGGNCTWDEVCYAIYKNRVILGAIPVYENYQFMQGGDGAFPDPQGEIAGFHALCFYGYDADTLYFLHSWGTWCGRYGSLSKEYFNQGIDYFQFFVVLDTKDVAIARGNNSSCLITCAVPALVTVDGVVIGNAPQKISVEKGRSYLVSVSAAGYISETRMVDENTTELNFVLEPSDLEPIEKKTWFQIFIDWILRLFRRK